MEMKQQIVNKDEIIKTLHAKCNIFEAKVEEKTKEYNVIKSRKRNV